MAPPCMTVKIKQRNAHIWGRRGVQTGTCQRASAQLGAVADIVAKGLFKRLAVSIVAEEVHCLSEAVHHHGISCHLAGCMWGQEMPCHWRITTSTLYGAVLKMLMPAQYCSPYQQYIQQFVSH